MARRMTFSTAVSDTVNDAWPLAPVATAGETVVVPEPVKSLTVWPEMNPPVGPMRVTVTVVVSP
jgi:hypothetical protein